MNNYSKYKNLRLFKVFEIENDYKKHKDRLMQIRTGASHHSITEKSSRAATINTVKRIRMVGEYNRARKRESKIYRENELLHQSLKKVFLRKNPTGSQSKNNLRSSKSEKSLLKLRNRSIEEENTRLLNRLHSTRSTLSRDKQIEHYSHNQPLRDRITTKSPKRKQELRKIMQRKFNLDPVVVLPKVRTATNTPTHNLTALT